VEFKRVTSIKIGSPNHEVLRGHSLWGSGLEFYSAHEVENSPWIAELTEVGRARERFDESQRGGHRHYVLTFHDETLECIAKWTVTRIAPGVTMPEVLARLSAEALLGRDHGGGPARRGVRFPSPALTGRRKRAPSHWGQRTRVSLALFCPTWYEMRIPDELDVDGPDGQDHGRATGRAH
jgi:hypothetical protein